MDPSLIELLLKSACFEDLFSSVADPGSGAFLTLDPGSGIGFSRISDPGSQPHIFNSLMTSVWVKSTIILSVLAKKISFSVKKRKLFTIL